MLLRVLLIGTLSRTRISSTHFRLFPDDFSVKQRRRASPLIWQLLYSYIACFILEKPANSIRDRFPLHSIANEAERSWKTQAKKKKRKEAKSEYRWNTI